MTYIIKLYAQITLLVNNDSLASNISNLRQIIQNRDPKCKVHLAVYLLGKDPLEQLAKEAEKATFESI